MVQNLADPYCVALATKTKVARLDCSINRVRTQDSSLSHVNLQKSTYVTTVCRHALYERKNHTEGVTLV